MPSVSPAQARFFAACSHGAGYASCPPAKVSREFNQADKGTGILRRAEGGLTERPLADDAATLVPVMPGDESVPAYIRAMERVAEQRKRDFGMKVKEAFGGLVDQPRGYASGGLGAPQMHQFGRSAAFGARQVQNGVHPVGVPGVHLIHSAVPGRTDRISMNVRKGSYVLPADVVSGLGQGNTFAGAKMWGQAVAHGAGPYGAGAGGVKRAAPMKLPSPPRPMRLPAPVTRFADGGADDGDMTQILAAGGEVLIDPEMVEALGMGDPEAGKKCLNDSVLSVRKQVVNHTKNLPGPVQ